MKKNTVLFVFLICVINCFGQTVVELGETPLNSEKNSFEYIITVGSDTVYRYEVIDYSVECELEFKNNEIVSYTFFDLLSGIKWSVIICVEENIVMKTEKYDFDAVGDKIDYDAYCCGLGKVEVLSNSESGNSYYKVNQKRIH
jgi:hypothetical protein